MSAARPHTQAGGLDPASMVGGWVASVLVGGMDVPLLPPGEQGDRDASAGDPRGARAIGALQRAWVWLFGRRVMGEHAAMARMAAAVVPESHREAVLAMRPHEHAVILAAAEGANAAWYERMRVMAYAAHAAQLEAAAARRAAAPLAAGGAMGGLNAGAGPAQGVRLVGADELMGRAQRSRDLAQAAGGRS